MCQSRSVVLRGTKHISALQADPAGGRDMNRFIEQTGVQYPIIQAPMGWIARSQLASAVSNAGGLGIIESSSGDTVACRAEIEKMGALTDKPFGVNLALRFLADDAMLRFICEESGVKYVTTSAGSPKKWIKPLHDADIGKSVV